ncbi:hypothetical protein ACQUQP_09145 [Marinobacterium sp. YM272]|uniref:hypothetical protein n=1 Tax=Marinobacterium sp. YM272 TaxID=3421654 RepID=UPI003D7F231A
MMRVMVVHLHAVSARLHFWVQDAEQGTSACLPRPLSPLSILHTDYQPQMPVPLAVQLLEPAAQRLGLKAEQLSVASPLLGWVEEPRQWTPVALLRIAGDDLPALPAGRFITLMELLQVPVTERLLMRQAYEALLGD